MRVTFVAFAKRIRILRDKAKKRERERTVNSSNRERQQNASRIRTIANARALEQAA